MVLPEAAEVEVELGPVVELVGPVVELVGPVVELVGSVVAVASGSVVVAAGPAVPISWRVVALSLLGAKTAPAADAVEAKRVAAQKKVARAPCTFLPAGARIIQWTVTCWLLPWAYAERRKKCNLAKS